MSNDDPDERDDSDSRGSEVDDRAAGIRLEVGLRSLTDLLGDLVEVAASGSPPPPERHSGRSTVDENVRDRRRRTRVGDTTSEEHLVETHFDDDEFVVTADIPGATKDDLSVGIDRTTNELVIAKDGTVRERVDLPWPSPEATRVWFNNGILEIRLRESDS